MKSYSFLRQGIALLVSISLFSSCSKNDDATAAVYELKTMSADAQSSQTLPSNGKMRNTVIMQDMRFDPYELVILPGETVTWMNTDDITYSVTADDGSFDSGDIQPGGTYSRTFTTPGEFFYHSRHGFEMTGKITVEGAKP